MFVLLHFSTTVNCFLLYTLFGVYLHQIMSKLLEAAKDRVRGRNNIGAEKGGQAEVRNLFLLAALEGLLMIHADQLTGILLLPYDSKTITVRLNCNSQNHFLLF